MLQILVLCLCSESENLRFFDLTHTSLSRRPQTGSRARSGERSERTLDAVEDGETMDVGSSGGVGNIFFFRPSGKRGEVEEAQSWYMEVSEFGRFAGSSLNLTRGPKSGVHYKFL